MTLALRILLSVPFWLTRLAVLLILAAIGFPLIAWQLGRIEVRASRHFPDRMLTQFSAWWMAPYVNDEDGIDGLRGGNPAQQWWADRTAGWSSRKRIFIWSALRNPVDSLRWIPILNPKLDPSRVRFIGMDHEPFEGEGGWYFAWLDGTAYSCIRYETKHFRFWLGTKIHPEDRLGLQPGDYRAIRCDFAAQLKRIKR